ncbi:MAG: hypothetical protein U5N85_08565 [Arcicella sp.]|nr:hypothetical protein [Arcicella sp.]
MKLFIFLSILSFSALSYSNLQDDFIGSYSTKPNGQAEVIPLLWRMAFITVTGEGEKFKLEHAIGSMWDNSIDTQTRKCILDGISCEVVCIFKSSKRLF